MILDFKSFSRELVEILTSLEIVKYDKVTCWFQNSFRFFHEMLEVAKMYNYEES